MSAGISALLEKWFLFSLEGFCPIFGGFCLPSRLPPRWYRRSPVPGAVAQAAGAAPVAGRDWGWHGVPRVL